jgi:hypothetical protein
MTEGDNLGRSDGCCDGPEHRRDHGTGTGVAVDLNGDGPPDDQFVRIVFQIELDPDGNALREPSITSSTRIRFSVHTSDWTRRNAKQFSLSYGNSQVEKVQPNGLPPGSNVDLGQLRGGLKPSSQ